MRPLDRLSSIKVKFGVVIVATVWGTMLVLVAGHRLGLSFGWRVVIADRGCGWHLVNPNPMRRELRHDACNHASVERVHANEDERPILVVAERNLIDRDASAELSG